MWFCQVIDSIAQWTKALSAHPKICSSWHLQGATIPIGANVRVGLFNPHSEIKISFIAFHSGCLIQLDHLHYIRSIDFLTERSCHLSPSCHVSTSLCLTSKSILKSFTVLFGLLVSKRVILVIRSRVLSSKSLIMSTGT